jgi:hypothetical protein
MGGVELMMISRGKFGITKGPEAFSGRGCDLRDSMAHSVNSEKPLKANLGM